VRLTRFSIIGILMAVILGTIAIVPVFAASTGTIVLSKAFVSPTGSATITVDDADLNTLTAASTTVSGSWGSSLSAIGFTLPLDTVAGDSISGVPTVTVDTSTADVAATNFSVTVFNTATGSIVIQSFAATSATLTIDFNLAQVQTTTAKVTSPSDTTGITVTLTESGPDTGIFAGLFTVGTESSDTTDTIVGVAGQIVTAKYTDADPAGTRTDTVTIEDTEPAGTVTSPADGLAATTTSPKLIAEFVDTDSGVDEGTITFTVVSAIDLAGTDQKANVAQTAPTTTAITNGFKGEVTLSAATAFADGTTTEITWRVTGTDKAGNTGQTDSGSASGDQDHTFIVDKDAPDFANATASAGAWFDTSDNTVEESVTKSSSTSIGIKLPDILVGEDESLNADTVTAADFEVDTLKKIDGTTVSDLTPTAAAVNAKAGNWIFLTVPEMAPDAAPTVKLLTGAGGISDGAGNATSAALEISSSDKQAPTVTATLNRSLDDGDATVTITTNEAGQRPVVTANGTSQTVTLSTTNVYTSKITPGDGAWSIQVTVQDGSTNETELGSATPSVDFPESGDIALYIDNAIPAPTVKINGDSASSGQSVENSVPFFLTADYADEGKEYGVSGTAMVLATATTVDDDLDVHATVTIATATLDGVSILGLVDTQDNVNFSLAVLDMATGDHTFVLVGEDQAGNTLTTTSKFTVTARKAYSLSVSAGWNLVSFPGEPTDNSIASVLPAGHPSTDVLTFSAGQWTGAVRVGDAWQGDLKTIDGGHAYWINTSSSETVSALLSLPSVGTSATLPSIAIQAGWNLVPVTDLDQAKIAGAPGDGGTDERAVGTYFTSIDWSVAYTYSASTRAWTRLVDGTGVVQNGQGVWVWANKAGTLIP